VFLFHPTDQFQIISGQAPIVIGAPHHGTRPNVDADLGTGTIALALASRLKARAVIVSDLRRTVDVNKNPANMRKSVIHHAIRYQNEMFADLPQLVIEIHGHVSGQYPVEVTSGFDLNPNAPGDAVFLERLHALKHNLQVKLADKLGQAYPVGVFPLDRDVKKTATNTFTYQKIRRARNLTGQEWYGIHIELAAELRTTKLAKSKGYVDALVDALAASIRFAFEPLPEEGSLIPIRADMMNNEDGSSQGIALKVISATETTVDENSITIHQADLEALDVLNGDSISLVSHGEELQTVAKSSLSIRQGQTAIPARLRRQLNLSPGDSVTVKRILLQKIQTREMQNRNFVMGEVRAQSGLRVWINPDDMERLELKNTRGVSINQQNLNIPPTGSIILEPDPTLAKRVAALSADLVKKRTITIAEVFMIEAANDK